MGAALAAPMMQSVGKETGQAESGLSSPPPLPGRSWHRVESGQPVGPFNLEELAEAVGRGQLVPSSLVWSAGMMNWVAAGEVPELSSLFPPGPPPIPES